MKLKRAFYSSGRGKTGFTLIELLIVMVILAILAGVVVISVGNIFSETDETAYNIMRHQIQQAVIGYMANVSHVGDLPIIGGNTTVIVDGEVRYMLDICKVKIPEGMLRKAPEGCYGGPDTDDDNCDGGTCICDQRWHYLWAIDEEGNLFSVCVDSVENGGGCVNNSSDGFQHVWP